MNDKLKLGKNEENYYSQKIQEIEEKLNTKNTDYKLYLERLNLIKTLIIFESSMYSQSYFLAECNKVLEMLMFDLKKITKNPDIYYYIAIIYDLKKDTNNNRKYIKKALKVNPNHLLSRLHLIEKLVHENGEDVTENEFTKLLKIYTDNILIYKKRAVIRSISFYNYEGSIEDYEKLKELDKENIDEYNASIKNTRTTMNDPKMQDFVALMKKPKKNTTLPQIVLIAIAVAIVIIINLVAGFKH